MRVSALSESNVFRCIRYGPLQTIASIARRSIKAHTYAYLCSIARWVFHSYLPVSPADFSKYLGFIHIANFASFFVVLGLLYHLVVTTKTKDLDESD